MVAVPIVVRSTGTPSSLVTTTLAGVPNFNVDDVELPLMRKRMGLAYCSGSRSKPPLKTGWTTVPIGSYVLKA